MIGISTSTSLTKHHKTIFHLTFQCFDIRNTENVQDVEPNDDDDEDRKKKKEAEKRERKKEEVNKN